MDFFSNLKLALHDPDTNLARLASALEEAQCLKCKFAKELSRLISLQWELLTYGEELRSQNRADIAKARELLEDASLFHQAIDTQISVVRNPDRRHYDFRKGKDSDIESYSSFVRGSF